MINKKKYSNGPLSVGSLFILFGLIWVLRNLGYINFNLREWWPLILIAVGLLNISNHRDMFSFPGLLLISLGVIFLLKSNDVLKWNKIIKFWPAVLIIIGLSMLIGTDRKIKEPKDSDDKDNYISGFALFFGLKRKVSSMSFRGGDITVLFGGAEIDLRNAKMNPDGAVLNLMALFGGVEIMIPDDWDIEINSTALFGSVSNRSRGENHDDEKPLKISATTIFGGVEVKN